MSLVRFALSRPITVLVAVLAIAIGALLSLRRMPVDIFPRVGPPAIYVAQPYGGMDPSQMEGFLTYYYEYHFLYITGIEHVESKSVQGVALMKLVFHPGTDMNQAMAETIGYVNRSRAFMPPGAVPPFVTRFDAGSVPVGQLVFTSETRPPGELQDFALNRVRPLFATLPGVSAPPPFGGNQRTIVVRLDPDKLRQYRVSPEEAITAVNRASTVMPSGVVRTGDLARMAQNNGVIGGNLDELNNSPVRTGQGPTVFLRDIGVAENGTDILTAYAHVNGKRTVYIQVTKRSDASTLSVIRDVRANLPKFQAVLPEDVKVTLEFDQSVVVEEALRALVQEGALGALLTGLMVILFLRDWRGALIVITTIPAALLSAIVLLWLTGQSINIMTLGGLALAVGVLVDEATVEIENAHSHLDTGMSRARAVYEACRKTALPRFLAMVTILCAFVPSIFMTGIAQQLFLPLSFAVGFAMISSFALSSTLVPVMAVWLMRAKGQAKESAGRLRAAYRRYVAGAVALRWPLAAAYLVAAFAGLWFLAPRLGLELFPEGRGDQIQLRLRAPTGTRIERTELYALQALDIIKREAGEGNVAISTGFIGLQPASYPINTVYLWTSGPHEAVLKIALKPEAAAPNFREKLRAAFKNEMPEIKVAFEAGGIVEQVIALGSPTPVEVAVQGPNIVLSREFAAKLKTELEKLSFLRDLQYGQPMDYPTLEVTVDRARAGQYGLTAADVTKSLVTATSSSRFVDPNYWRDPASGNAFQIQVEIPQNRVKSMDDVASIPVMKNGQARPLLSDVASLTYGQTMGLVERYNMQRVVSLTADVHGVPLGDAVPEVRAAIARVGEPPRGVTVAVRGQIPALEDTLAGLRGGLLLTVGAVFLLMAASFQSFRLAVAVVSTLPAALLGVVLALHVTGTTLNVQSFMGAIMATGIAVANAILLVSFAERSRKEVGDAKQAAVDGASGRVRAVLMTASAMIAGMIPLAMGSAQTAPLGRAVIGGLAAGTIATLTILPSFYAILQARAPSHSPSLNPNDPESRFHEAL